MAKALAAAVILLGLSACPSLNECSFWMRCDGGVVEQCGDGVDEQLGRRVRAKPCPPLNPVCVQDGDSAGCFVSAEACDAGWSRCDGEVALYCSQASGASDALTLMPMPRPYLVAEDCSVPVRFVDGGQYLRQCVGAPVSWCQQR